MATDDTMRERCLEVCGDAACMAPGRIAEYMGVRTDEIYASPDLWRSCARWIEEQIRALDAPVSDPVTAVAARWGKALQVIANGYRDGENVQSLTNTAKVALLSYPVTVIREEWRCPTCGHGVHADEDGCCVHCGGDCELVKCEVTVRTLRGAAPEPAIVPCEESATCSVCHPPRPEPVPEAPRGARWVHENYWNCGRCIDHKHAREERCSNCNTVRPPKEDDRGK